MRVLATPWIEGRWFDQFFLVGSWLVPFALWPLARSTPAGFMLAFWIYLQLDGSHQLATVPLTLLDRETMRRSGAFYWTGLLVMLGLIVILSFYPRTFAADLWLSLTLYWGAFHIVRQHYGFLRLYQHRCGPVEPVVELAEVVALYSGLAFPYLLNLSQGWVFQRQYARPFLRLPVPTPLAWLALAAFAASLVAVLAHALRQARAGRSNRALCVAHILLAVSNFWVGLLVAGRYDATMVILFITSYHDVQYHAVVWLVGRNRHAASQTPASLVARVFRFRSAFPYVTGAALGGFALFLFKRGSWMHDPSLRLSLMMFGAGVSYIHYLFDGKLWKLRENAQLRCDLRLGARAERPQARSAAFAP